MHSRHSPLHEAGQIASSLASPTAIVVLGNGLGYAAEAAVKAWPKAALVIVEKRASILRLALETRDLRPLLQHEKLAFVLGSREESSPRPGAVEAAVHTLAPGEPPALIRNRALMRLDQAWFEEADKSLTAYTIHVQVNRSTTARFGKRWERNKKANAALHLPSIEHFKCILQLPEHVQPVLLIAAGPSLDGLEKEIQEKAACCVVIAVDTVLHFLQRIGVKADYAVVGDPQYYVVKHMERVTMPGTVLIAQNDVYPAVLRTGHFGKTYFYSSERDVGQESGGKKIPSLSSGGSVATAAWDFARFLGARTIYIAGLDLGYPGSRTHFKGAAFENEALNASTRLVPAETRSFHALRDASPYFVKALDGSPLLTDKRLALYASWFEASFAAHPEIQNYSLSPCGYAIKGLRPT
jgi:hypothetical protein